MYYKKKQFFTYIMYVGIHYVNVHNRCTIPLSDLIQTTLVNRGIHRKTPCILTQFRISSPQTGDFQYMMIYGDNELDVPKRMHVESEPTELYFRPLEQCVASGLQKWTLLEITALQPRPRNMAPYELKLEFTIKIIDVHDSLLVAQVSETEQTTEKQAALLAHLIAKN
jgi:hypothetical protein